MPIQTAGPLHAYLAGTGQDGRGRLARDVLRLSDAELERIHDYIQWLFPLPTRSAAQPGAPVLSTEEIDAIRADSQALETLNRATDRMLQFYRNTSWWRAWQDHNHLRITRIIHSLRLLAGPGAASHFHGAIMALLDTTSAEINPRSLRYWADAVRDEDEH
jgi:hypothetical protein